MVYENLICSLENNIAVITFNRSDAMNAFGSQLIEELNFIVDEIEKSSEIRVVIIKGGKNFSAGVDLKERKKMNKEERWKHSRDFARLITRIERLPQATIALIRGYCIGGGFELALCCDFRIASGNARVGLPEIKLGIFPGAGGTQRLARLIGPGNAKLLVFSGKFIPAVEAQTLGILEEVVSDHMLEETGWKIAAEIASNSPLGVVNSKKAINSGIQMDLQNALGYEEELFRACFYSQDYQEGLNAFNEKRKPLFEGK